MQRGRLIERPIEVQQRTTNIALPSADARPFEVTTHRKSQEARNRKCLDRDQALAVQIQFLAGPADSQRQRIQQVRRPVRKDGPTHERNVSLPRKHHYGDVRSPARRGIGEIVSQKEKRSKEGEPQQRSQPGPLVYFSGSHPTRSARPTVKSPSGSIRCSSFRNPAVRTSSSSSSCVRR